MIAKYKKNIMVRRLITIAAVIVSALLQTYVIQAFIRPANLLSSGFTGVAILIDRIASLYGHNNLHSAAFQLAAQIVMKVFQFSTLLIK